MRNRDSEVQGTSRRLLPRWIAWIALAIVFGFIANIIFKNWSQLIELEINCELSSFALSCGFLSMAIFGSCVAWYFILRSLKIETSYRLTQYNWFISNLGKYVPGKIWTATGRAYLHHSHNHASTAIVAATGFEALVSLSAAVFITLVLMVHLNQLTIHFAPLTVLLAFLLLFLSPRLFNRFVNFGLNWIKMKPLNVEIGFSRRLVIFVLEIVAFSFRGAGFYFFVRALFPNAPHDWLFFFYASIFSNLLGLLAFFAPKGLGVREGVLILVLGPVISEAAAIAISIASRFWLIMSELFLIFLVYLFAKPLPRE